MEEAGFGEMDDIRDFGGRARRSQWLEIIASRESCGRVLAGENGCGYSVHVVL